jgi:hypothetical protein
MKNDPLELVARWAALARQEPALPVDVSGRVTRALRAQGEGTKPDPALLWFATASAVAASVAAMFAFILYQRISDPLWTLFESVRVFIP